MWQIVIFMVMGFGNTPDVYPDKSLDALVITHYEGKPLNFVNEDDCIRHMWRNIDALKSYASSRFDGRNVDKIICQQQTEI